MSIPTSPSRKRKKRIYTLLAALIVLLVGGWFAYRQFWGNSQVVEYMTSPVEKGSIKNVVTATGTVEAVVTVSVGSQVSGQCEKLYADYNSVVKCGQLLAKLDPRNYEAQLENAQASLLAAQARIRMVEADILNQRASLRSSQANLAAARATRDNDARTLKRYEDLIKSGIASQSDFDNAKTTADASVAKYEQVEASIAQADAQIRSAQASLNQAKAQEAQAVAELDRAKVNLEYTNIVSPVDGVVVSRSIDVGQTVAASLSAPTLFVIANDLTKMRVKASIDEADIGKISDQVDVKFTVDAYPQETFQGTISEVRLEPTTVQNVVTYSVIISVDNAHLKLKPGMTANISITVAEKADVLKLANAALRYTPPDMTPEKVREIMRAGREGKAEDAGRPGGERAGQTESAPPSKPAALAKAPAEGANPAQGLPPQALELLKKAQDPSLGQDGRRAIFMQMRELGLTEEQKGLLRDMMRGGRGGERPTAGRSPAAGEAPRVTGSTAGLAPGQMWDPTQKIRFPEPMKTRRKPGICWVLDAEGKPAPRRVMLGITDGVSTELLDGDLKPGDKVIVGDTSQNAGAAGGQQRNPFAQPRGGGPRR